MEEKQTILSPVDGQPANSGLYMETNLTMISKIHRHKESYVAPHAHDNTELVMYIKGSGESRIADKDLRFSDGCIAVIPGGVIHDERHNSDADIIYFCFDFSEFSIPAGIYAPGSFQLLTTIAKQIHIEIKSPRFAGKTMIRAKLCELCTLLMRDILSSRYDERMNSCMRELSEHCCESIDIRKLCADYGFGYESFRHNFRKLYGMAPQNFITYKRLVKACELLTSTALPCTDIAFMCGFSDSAQFSKMFKKQFGTTPRAYRELV